MWFSPFPSYSCVCCLLQPSYFVWRTNCKGPYLVYLILTGWNTFVFISVFVPSLDMYISAYCLPGLGTEVLYSAHQQHTFLNLTLYVSEKGCAVSQGISCWHHSVEAWVQLQASPCGKCSGWSGTGTGFSPSTVIFTCHYHSTSAPYSFSHTIQS